MKLNAIYVCAMVAAITLCCHNQVLADDVSGNNIPGILYDPSTGLVMVDPDGLIVTESQIVFRDRNTGEVGHNTNTYFDNSLGNPLFASNGGLIPDWDSGDNGEGIWGESTSSGYDGSPLCWAQISSGLGEEDFLYARYNFPEGPIGGVQTNVTVVPEPATMGLLAIGGLMILRRKNSQ